MIGFDGIILYFLTQIRMNVVSDSLYAETGIKILEGEFFFFTNSATTAGIHPASRRCQPLDGALIFTSEKRLFDAVVDKIPGETLIRATLSVDVEIRVYSYRFKGLGPVAAVGMGQ